MDPDKITLRLQLPMKALSLNNAYISLKSKGRLIRVLAPKARTYKADVKRILEGQVPDGSDFSAYKYIDLKFVFSEKWHVKDMSKYRKRDISNLPKLVEDSLFDVLGVDDSRVRSLSLLKDCTQGTDRPDMITITVTLMTTEEEADVSS